MSRPRYRLTIDDVSIVRKYIERAMKRPDGGISSAAGYGAFVAASQSPEALQTWCEEFISQDVWKKIMVILRQARMGERKKRVRIDVPHYAHLALKRVARDMGKRVTFAEAIERMEECYWAVKDDAAAAKPKPPRRTKR